MTSISWVHLCGVVALAVIIFASLMLPPSWQRLRTGHWAVEHFLAYFAATSIVCFGWRGPFVVCCVETRFIRASERSISD